MSNARFFSAMVLTAVVTGTLVAGLTLSLPAHAEAPRTAACKVFPTSGGFTNLSKYTADVASWMEAELLAGRTQFTQLSPSVLCSW
jgi:hypothetical protein